MSKAALSAKIELMRLRPGDVVVAKDIEVLKAVQDLGLPLAFKVPLVYAPSGVQVLSRADLLNLLEQLEEVQEVPTEQAGAPL